ncbi:hypothetical protein AAFF_G00276340 [Aldrovandia affinis]|uniref:Ig-like domain-containing protein n=1 Tax=Aldrovandia affinis TaxID=143900 RepID=A0AAD7RAG2_9TELE|nr:hypothetical protein AAFF_G00276340 [Aldrovandia affinis]
MTEVSPRWNGRPSIVQRGAWLRPGAGGGELQNFTLSATDKDSSAPPRAPLQMDYRGPAQAVGKYLGKVLDPLADDVAPYFKTEPGLPQTHLEGNRLVMTCLAEGSWPLEFKWMLNNTDITSFSPEYKYTVPSLQRSDAGFYQCVVRNRMGALMQRKAEVQVAYMGNFVEQEQRKTVSQGKAAILGSPAVSSFPRPQVTWFRDGYKIIPSNRVPACWGGERTPVCSGVEFAATAGVRQAHVRGAHEGTRACSRPHRHLAFPVPSE